MEKNIKEKLKELLLNQRFAVIATQEKNEPYTNLVSFLADFDSNKIYFPTLKNSKKYENISANSSISILIDNRSNNPEDIKNALAVTAVGKSKDLDDIRIVDIFLKKHPYLKDFVKSNNCVLIQIDIEKYIVVNNFKNVNILNF